MPVVGFRERQRRHVGAEADDIGERKGGVRRRTVAELVEVPEVEEHAAQIFCALWRRRHPGEDARQVFDGGNGEFRRAKGVAHFLHISADKSQPTQCPLPVGDVPLPHTSFADVLVPQVSKLEDDEANHVERESLKCGTLGRLGWRDETTRWFWGDEVVLELVNAVQDSDNVALCGWS